MQQDGEVIVKNMEISWKSELTGGRQRWLDYQGDADTNFLSSDKKVPPGDHGMRLKAEKQHNRHEKFKKY